MAYLVAEIEADDEFYSTSSTHIGEYRVVDDEDCCMPRDSIRGPRRLITLSCWSRRIERRDRATKTGVRRPAKPSRRRGEQQ